VFPLPPDYWFCRARASCSSRARVVSGSRLVPCGRLLRASVITTTPGIAGAYIWPGGSAWWPPQTSQCPWCRRRCPPPVLSGRSDLRSNGYKLPLIPLRPSCCRERLNAPSSRGVPSRLCRTLSLLAPYSRKESKVLLFTVAPNPSFPLVAAFVPSDSSELRWLP
jgi:hypothetical protein